MSTPDQRFDMIRRCPTLAGLGDDDVALVAARVVRRQLPFGAVLVQERDDRAPSWSLVVEGTVRLIGVDRQGAEHHVAFAEVGDAVGGLTPNEVTPTPTVRASSPTVVLTIDRLGLEHLATAVPRFVELIDDQWAVVCRATFLRTSTAFEALSDDALLSLAAAFEPLHVEADRLVLLAGDTTDAAYLLLHGRLDAADDADGAVAPGRPRIGELIGSTASFVPGEPRFGSVVTTTVSTVTSSVLLRLAGDEARALAASHPELRECFEALGRTGAEIVGGDALRSRVPTDPPSHAGEAEVREPHGPGPDSASPDVAEHVESTPLGGPAGTTEPLGRRRSRGIRRFPIVYQIDEMDCAPAALAAVCRHFGDPVALSRARQVVGAGSGGTSLKGLVQGARELGLEAHARKVSMSALDSIELPAIAHWDGNHWLVVHRVDRRGVRVFDPASGTRRYSRAEFEQRWTGYLMLVAPAAEDRPGPRRVPRLQWLRPLVRPHVVTLIVSAVLGLLVAGLEMLVPVFSQIIVDHVLVHHEIGLLRTLIGGLGAAVLATAAFTTLQRLMLARLAVLMDRGSLDHLMTHLLSLPMQYFERRRVGDIQRRLNGLRQARQFVVQSGVRVVASLAQLLLAMVLMVLYSTTLAAVFLAALPCYVVALRVSLHRLRPLVDTLEDEFGRYSSRQVDAIKGIETVKAMATEDYVKRHLGETFDGLARRQFRVDFFGMAFDGAIRIAGFVSLALFLWIGALQVTSGALSVGSYVSFNALAAIAGAAIVALLTVWDDLQYATILLDRVEDVFTEEPERGTDRVAGAPSIDLHGNVSVERLTFAYGDDAKVLDDVSIEVAAGTRIAIVGRSGSGKTTLLRCLAGLIEPTAGAVLYDGIDLRELDVRTVRAGMGVVLQDSYLFDDTISANIAFGIDRPDPEQVMWAARMAGAHEFISRLPFRYQTRVGESGLALSGGERQRICIARALYRRPPVVLLDEATSALDSESERAVKQGLDELLRGKTVFVVAHRMSTVRDADLIVVLDRGRIVERGTHLELMERRGLYYRLSGDRLDV